MPRLERERVLRYLVEVMLELYLAFRFYLFDENGVRLLVVIVLLQVFLQLLYVFHLAWLYCIENCLYKYLAHKFHAECVKITQTSTKAGC